MRLLIDMNLSPRWVDYFTLAGQDAVHWSSVGAVDAPDSAIMIYAVANDYVVFTHDLDFSAILAASQADKPSVIQVRGDSLNPEKLGAIVLEALARTEAELEAGALVTVDARRMRLRILPLNQNG